MLERIAGVKKALAFQISRVCQLWRGVGAKAFLFAPERHGCPPSVSVAGNAKNARLAIGLSGSPVLQIDLLGYIPQVAVPVVGSDSIDVVNLTSGESASHVHEGQPMAVMVLLIDHQHDIAKRLADVSGLLPAFGGSPTVRKPCEHSGFQVVVKKLAQTLRGKIGLSHDALQLLIGQRPASVDSTVRASSFYGQGA